MGDPGAEVPMQGPHKARDHLQEERWGRRISKCEGSEQGGRGLLSGEAGVRGVWLSRSQGPAGLRHVGMGLGQARRTE